MSSKVRIFDEMVTVTCWFNPPAAVAFVTMELPYEGMMVDLEKVLAEAAKVEPEMFNVYIITTQNGLKQFIQRRGDRVIFGLGLFLLN